MLVVLRGNSGSGKSTVARLLQERLRETGPTAVLAQDVLRRHVYREREQEGLAHAELLVVAAGHCLEAGHHVIIEGILNARRYGPYLERVDVRAEVAGVEPDDRRWYAFDLSLEETLRRHAGRPQAAEFGEDSLRRWYHGWNPLTSVTERRIGPEETAEEVVDRILVGR